MSVINQLGTRTCPLQGGTWEEHEPTFNHITTLHQIAPRQKLPVIGAELVASVGARIQRSLSGVEGRVVEGANIDLGVVSVPGVLVELVPVTSISVSRKCILVSVGGVARTR